jgi:hypothetical protein
MLCNITYCLLKQVFVIAFFNSPTCLSPGEHVLPHSFSGANDESLDVSSHLGWKNAAASDHETETFVDR